MKKLHVTIIAFLMLLTLFIAGCSNSKENKSPSSGLNQIESDQTTQENLSDEQTADEKPTSTIDQESLGIYKYSEDKAWISFKTTDEDDYKFGCIDKEGKMLFYFSGIDLMTANPVPYSNGYCYFENADALYLIDTEGQIINKYQSIKNNAVKSYADGYVWMEQYTSGFDTAFYKYTLFDAEGNTVAEFEHDGTTPISEIYYYSSGVWGYDTQNNDGQDVQRFYCTDSHKWVESTIAYGNHNIYFWDDKAVIGISYYDPDQSGYRAKLCLMDIAGNIDEIALSGDLGWNWDEPNFIKEKYCVLEEYENYLVSYNIENGELSKMENEYTEKIKTTSFPEVRLFDNGKIALTLTGSDEENYVALFDTSWNLVGTPVKYTKYNYSEGMLTVLDMVPDDSGMAFHDYLTVYDSDGNKLFSPTDKGYVSITPFENGIARALPSDADSTVRSAVDTIMSALATDNIDSLSGEFIYIDKEGNPLFETIDMTSAIEIDLKQY